MSGLGRLIIVLSFLVVITPAFGQNVEGFTEPFRNISVAAAEPGLIASIDVEEGEFVKKGQVLARLRQDVLRISQDIAQKSKDAKGQLASAVAEQRSSADRLEKFRLLLTKQHASQEEVDRAETEMEVAAARVLAIRESLQVKELEYERIKAQLTRRTIRSPIDGIVTEILKDQGEYVAPTAPAVVNVVRLDRLLATFSVPTSQFRELSPGQNVRVAFHLSQKTVRGTVRYISPVTNAQSGTVKIKVLLPNSDGKLRSGTKCSLLLADHTKKITRKSKSSRSRTTRPRSATTN